MTEYFDNQNWTIEEREYNALVGAYYQLPTIPVVVVRRMLELERLLGLPSLVPDELLPRTGVE